jgi:hypothetical protein
VSWISRDLIVSPIYICLCINEKQFHKALRHLAIAKNDYPDYLKTPHANATVHFLINNKTGKECAIICLGNTKGIETLQIYSLLIHEAVHIWQAIKDHIGESKPSMEFEAYSIQAICRRLMYDYKEMVNKK